MFFIKTLLSLVKKIIHRRQPVARRSVETVCEHFDIKLTGGAFRKPRPGGGELHNLRLMFY